MIKIKKNVALTLFVPTLLSGYAFAQQPIVLNDNAGWCWYQDERAIIADNKLVFGSVASKLGTQGKARSGNIETTTYDLSAQSPAVINVMHQGLEDDDHNVPALLVLPDDNILSVYTKHNSDHFIRSRITKPNSQFNQWQSETKVKRKDKVTYANLMRLSEGNEGNGRIYNFYRGINFNPTFDTSDDNGKTWTKGTHFITNEGRPYVKYISNNEDKIHFVTTEQHPRVFDNSIYHGYLKNNKVYQTNGHLVHDMADGAFAPEILTKIYQGGKNNVAWTTDLHLDKNGDPYTVFSVQMNDGDKNRHQKGQLHGDDMRYYFAKWQQPEWWAFWQSPKWQVNEIAYAGSRLYDKEQDYTGLAALYPDNPYKMVISTNVNPSTGKPLISQADNQQHWELYQGVSQNHGQDWSWKPITQNSTQDNIRPVIPMNPESDDTYLLWMRGTYVTYMAMDTDIVMLKNPN